MDQHIFIAPQILALTPAQKTEIAEIQHLYNQYIKTVDASATGGTTAIYVNQYHTNTTTK